MHYFARHSATLICVIGALVSLGWSDRALAQSTAGAIQMRLAEATPGTTIEIPAGTVTLDAPIILARSGTELAPITLRAKERGKTVIAGRAGIELRGASHIVIEGLSFTHEARTPAIKLIDCKNVRITRCSFKLDSDFIPRQNWIHITGGKSENNRIDHNLFDELDSPGAYIAIDGAEAAPFQMSKGDRIDYNHFRNIGRRAQGGARAIRLGWTKLGESQGQTIVEYNLFEACNGDDELISVRSSGQTIRHNTFQNCGGYVTLRLGSGNIVEGNFFFCENKESVGGVRIHGDEARVYNNYFEGLTAPAIIIANGAPAGDAPVIDAPRPPASKAAVAFNTWVNCGGGVLEIGNNQSGSLSEPPTDCVVANNVAIGFGDELVRVRGKAEGVTWLANIMFNASDKDKIGLQVPENQINPVFPRLRNQGGIWRLSPNSPAIDYAQGDFDFVAIDIDGQPRPSKKDAGSDEFATGPIKQRPFTTADVGIEAP